MQPFDGVSQPQAKPAYPSAPQQGQPQGQYPGAPQQSGYPSLPNRPSNPQNYQAPFPSQNYQQQPAAGYPNYPAQPQQVIYVQGNDQGQDNIQKVLMAQQMSRNIKSSGGGLVACFSLIAAVAAVGIASQLRDQNNYNILLQTYNLIAGRNYNFQDAFSRDACQAFLADIIAIPIFLYMFAAFNFFAMCVSFTGMTCCTAVQGLAALGWFGLSAFASQQNCGAVYTLLTKAFGANNVPQNAYPYFAALGVASAVAACLNHSWSNSQEKAQRDKRNVALMMAS